MRTSPPETYTLSLHDALPICSAPGSCCAAWPSSRTPPAPPPSRAWCRSEEHTSELQSRPHLVCRLLLEKKNVTGRECQQTRSTAEPFRTGTATAEPVPRPARD